MNQSPVKCFVDFYDTPTFKTNTLRLVSNEGQLKCLLLVGRTCLTIVYMATTTLPTFIWLQLVTHFVTRATLARAMT